MWEWRAFAQSFVGLDDTFIGADEEKRDDIYLVAETLPPEWSLKLRGGDHLEAKRREESREGCERWTKVMSHALVVPPEVVRELARELSLGGKVPVRPVRDLAGALKLLQDVGFGKARAILVNKRLRRIVGPTGTLEHTQLKIGEEEWETVALGSDSPERLGELRDALGVTGEAEVASYSAFLAGDDG